MNKNKYMVCDNGNSASVVTDIVEDIPQWAVQYLLYGESDNLTAEDISLADAFCKEVGGSFCSVVEGSENDFCAHPAFGLACATVNMVIIG